MIKSKKIQTILLSCLLLVAVTPVFAAEIFYDAGMKEVQLGTEFEIGIFLNAEKENINALEGVLQFPAELLEFKKVNDGNSIINFWVERPHERQETRNKGQGEIVFSGITPGGFLGTQGLLFTATFFAKEEGRGSVEMPEITALLNDGQGTAADISVSLLEVVVTNKALPLPAKKEEKDQEPPESFAPEIARDPALFEGKWFLVFATQDKNSGIDHYEIKETRYRIFGLFSQWILAESPYALQDQGLRSSIFVKAVDKAGNKRIRELAPQHPLLWYENYAMWGIIIVGLILAWAMRMFLWKRTVKA